MSHFEDQSIQEVNAVDTATPPTPEKRIWDRDALLKAQEESRKNFGAVFGMGLFADFLTRLLAGDEETTKAAALELARDVIKDKDYLEFKKITGQQKS